MNPPQRGVLRRVSLGKFKQTRFFSSVASHVAALFQKTTLLLSALIIME